VYVSAGVRIGRAAMARIDLQTGERNDEIYFDRRHDGGSLRMCFAG